MSTDRKLLYEDLTYKVRGAMFVVHKELGPGHKEQVYQRALAKEFTEQGIPFETEKVLDVVYKNLSLRSRTFFPRLRLRNKDEKVGVYRPDFIVDDKVIIEIKAVSFLPRGAETQMSYYLRGTKYKLGLLVNFGSRRLDIRRRIYDKSRMSAEGGNR